MFRRNFLQKDNCHSWLLRLKGNWLYWNLRTASFKCRVLSDSRWCDRLGRLPSNEWFNSAHKKILLLGFLFLDFKIYLFRSKLHEGDIAKLMNIINRWCFFQLHFLFDRYGFYYFKILNFISSQFIIVWANFCFKYH